jgi:hypothetical protein
MNIVLTALGIFIGGASLLFLGIVTFGSIAHKLEKNVPNSRLKSWREFIYRLF